jgi:AcrR family transcriptional regulator
VRQEACATAPELLPVAADPTAVDADAALREATMEGALSAVGSLGYRATSVRAILERSGGHRAQFYEQFGSKEDCFEEAYAVWIERLGVGLLGAAATAGGWRAGVRAALTGLFEFAEERPEIARALLVEVQVAGGPALARREEALGRLAAAIDSVRGQIEPSEAPPEATGMFVVGGVEACVCDALAAGDPERVWDSLPELMHFAVGSYLGREAAEEEHESAQELLAERSRAEREGEER